MNKKRGEKKQFLKINAFRLGIAGGIVAAVYFAITTIYGIYGYFPFINMILLDMYGAFGYSISWLGVFVGAAYGLIDGFILFFILSFVYNKLLR